MCLSQKIFFATQTICFHHPINSGQFLQNIKTYSEFQLLLLYLPTQKPTTCHPWSSKDIFCRETANFSSPTKNRLVWVVLDRPQQNRIVSEESFFRCPCRLVCSGPRQFIIKYNPWECCKTENWAFWTRVSNIH